MRIFEADGKRYVGVDVRSANIPRLLTILDEYVSCLTLFIAREEDPSIQGNYPVTLTNSVDGLRHILADVALLRKDVETFDDEGLKAHGLIPYSSPTTEDFRNWNLDRVIRALKGGAE